MTKEEDIHLCLDDARERNTSAAISIDNSTNSKAKSQCSQLCYRTNSERSILNDEFITTKENVDGDKYIVNGWHDVVCATAKNQVESTHHLNTEYNSNDKSNDKNSCCAVDDAKETKSEEHKLLECLTNNTANFIDTSTSNSCDKRNTEKNDLVLEYTHLASNTIQKSFSNTDLSTETANKQNTIIANSNLDTNKEVLKGEQTMKVESEKEECSNVSSVAYNVDCSAVSDHHHHHCNDNVLANDCAKNDKLEEFTCVKHVDNSNDEESHLLSANTHQSVFTRENGTTRMNNTINKASKAMYFWGSLVATAVPGYLGKKTGLTSQFLHWNYIIPHLLLGAIPIVTQVGASGDHLDQLRRQLESRHETLGLVVACLEDDELNGFGMNFIQFAKEVDWRREVNRHVEYLKVAMQDTKAAVKLESVVDAVEKLHTCIDVNKQTAYVHCKAGKGRSWMVVMCYLTTYGGLPFDCAARLVQDRRVQINPSLAQQCFAREFAVRVAQNNLLKHSFITSHLQQHEQDHECQQTE